MATMDSTDLKIIRMLLRDARFPLSGIALRLGISMPAVQKRIEKLKSKGILVGSAVILNTGMIGWKRALVMVNVRRADYEDFLSQAAGLPLVSGVYQATGPYAVLLEFLGPAGVVNAVTAHVRKMNGVVDCCAVSLAEKVA
jgi:DNA-binding Lrp family transcriptional regulator